MELGDVEVVGVRAARGGASGRRRRLVEVFIEVLHHEDLAFQHTDDTDFETELAFERRVRDYAVGLKAAA